MASSSLCRLISKSSSFWNCRREIMTSASRISSSPLLILPPSNDGEKLDMNFYSPAHNKVGSIKGGSDVDHAKLVGSSQGWLALTKSRDDDLFLWNPVSRRRIDLPPLPWVLKGVHKVIVCSAGGAEEEWRVLMSQGRKRTLAICCVGGLRETTGGWYSFGLRDWLLRTHEDFAYSVKQNRLFFITQCGGLERWNLDTLEIDGSNEDEEKIIWPYDDDSSVVQYVVVAQHSNEVFVVARSIQMNVDGVSGSYKTVGFDVFKIHEDGDGNLRLQPSPSLDGLVMFVGINHSFALPAAQFPGLQTDSIYFTDDMELKKEGRHCSFGGHDVGIYDYQNKAFSSCYYPNDARAITRISPSPFWLTPSCH